MSLQFARVIEIPGSQGSAFDHGAFEPQTGRVFVAHTARNCVEVIRPSDLPRASSPTPARFW
jgi:hypothetical protein